MCAARFMRGASGHVVKKWLAKDLMEAIRAVLSGEKEPSEHLMRFPKGFKFERHWHDNPENLIVTEGAMVIVFDGGQEQTVRPGGYVRIPAKAPHWGRCPDGCTFYLGLVGPDSYYDK
jgi:quercetin dioxygenase-like cupin family protein